MANPVGPTVGGPRTIVFFPYLSMGTVDEVDLGFSKIWNFQRRALAHLPNGDARAHVTRILESYRSAWGPVDGIGVFSVDHDSIFEPQNVASQYSRSIREAKLILFLCFVAKNNTRLRVPNTAHWMATSDNFSEVYKNFIIGQDMVSEFSGVVIPSFNAGLTLGEFQYQRPGFVPNPIRFGYDEYMFATLLELRQNNPGVYGRILNATELLFESYYNSQTLSRNA